MSNLDDRQTRKKFIEQAVLNRRAVKQFAETIPSTEDVETIIKAGILAPFATIGTSREDEFRKFFIIPSDTEARRKIVDMLSTDAERVADQSQTRRSQEKASTIDGIEYRHSLPAKTNEQAQDLLYQFYLQKGHLELIATAPYFIIVAEKRRGPVLNYHLDRQSLAHCLHNMWLVASELGLGFLPISATAYLTKNQDFCDLLDVKQGEYEFDSFLLGYPAEPPQPNPKQINLEQSTRWIK